LDAKNANSESSTNIPAWIAVAVEATNRVNVVQFEAAFASGNGPPGLLSVFWNTNLIGTVDGRAVDPGLNVYRFGLPTAVIGGLYSLSFRLESFDGEPSSVTVTNISVGFAGVTQPTTLNISSGLNGGPIFRLTGPSNVTHLVETSTNLVDWNAWALFANTNGTLSFEDTSTVDSSAKFYRISPP
jgi:hypothetical protein